ncbi:MAG: serine protease, partial [Phycisphaerales bacterium]|nr:serine protease [Phycisphaerales bacterium]
MLFATLVLVAVLGTRSSTPQTFQHVADGPPPVLLPTGRLEQAYEFARDATVRIDERCATAQGEATLGMGTGFFVSAEGLVLTAYHVVDTASRPAGCDPHFVAVTPERSEYDLELVGFDAYMDLAMLQASVDRSMPFVRPATRAPTPGSPVVAVGNSRNDFLQPRAGEVTRLGVHAGRADFADNTMELTNSLAPGDSGGPVINERGEVVGVVSYISFNPGAMSSDSYVPPFLRGVALPRRFASYAVPVFDDASLISALAAGEKRDVPVVGFSWRQGMDYDPGSSDVYLGRRPGTIVVT